MALQLHISGPGLDVVRTVAPQAGQLVLGRDADCGICLPDPQRNVSRRHLAVWNDAGQLHFRVLSVVNGVQMPFGEAPPGAQGVLDAGQMFKLAEYTVTIAAVAAGPAEADPWAVFDREASGFAPLPEAFRTQAAPSPPGVSTAPNEEDPFGDWGFETTFGPGGMGGGVLDASKLAVPTDLSALYRGLGLDPVKLGPLSEGELEAIGRVLRAALEGLIDLHAGSGLVKQELRAEDRTMVAVKDNNPLKTDWPVETKLQYLFGGRAAGAGFLPPDRSVRDLVEELAAHNQAIAHAARAAVEGTVREFDPAALKTKLLGAARLFESARAWDAYGKHYAEQSQDLPRWVQRLLDKFFTEAYLQETTRVKRKGGSRPR